MAVDGYARAIRRAQAVRARYEPFVLKLRPSEAEAAATPALARAQGAQCQTLVQKLASRMREIIVAP